MIDESHRKNISRKDADEDFAAVTLANNFESSDDNIQNHATGEPTNQINLLPQKNFIK